MIPVSVMVTGKGTVSFRIKGGYGRGRPSRFTSVLKPVVFWNITYRCNLRCSHCYIAASPEDQRPELSRDELLDVAEQVVEQGIPLVVFTGGEPLVREDFWDVAERLAEHEKPKLSLSTNGTLVTRRVARRLRELGFTYIGVSIDSLDPEEHDRFRGVAGAFKAALKGIENAAAEGIPVGIRTTITAWNIDRVEEIVSFAYQVGAKRLSLYVLDTIGRGAEIKDQLPSPDQLRVFADKLVGLSKKYAGKLEILVVRANFIGVYLALKLSRDRGELVEYLSMLQAQGDCGRKTVSIYPDGTVRPCQFIDYVVIGDLKRERLSDILSPSNPRLKPFLDIHERLRGKRCSQCPFRRICGGGSRNRALVLEGDFWGDDPLCIVDYTESPLVRPGEVF